MTVPQCVARCCAGVADDGTGLCAAHRRSLTLSTKLQDAVREFLQGGHWQDAIRPTPDNARKVVEAGTQLAHALALLISTRFVDVSFDPSPLYAADLAHSPTATPWRVSFAWHANESAELADDEDEDSDDAEETGTDEP